MTPQTRYETRARPHQPGTWQGELPEQLGAQAAALRRLYDRDWMPESLRRAMTDPLPHTSNSLKKLQIMITYGINAVRIWRHRDLASQFGFSNRGSNALLAAFSACHLFRLSPREMVDAGILQILARAWLVILDLGDDILDDFVAARMPVSEAVELTREMINSESTVQKSAVFLRRVDPYLTESIRREIARRFFDDDLPNLARRMVEAFDFRPLIENCRTIDGNDPGRETRNDVEHALAVLFDVCIHSHALERTMLGCIATDEDVIELYRAKSAYFQYAYMGPVEALLRREPRYIRESRYIERLKRVGVCEMERSMFRDDVNDFSEDLLRGQPNLIVSIASRLEHSQEFTSLLHLALEGEMLTLVLLKRLAPQTYFRFMELQDGERRMLGLRNKPVFSRFVAFCTSLCSIGWRGTMRQHFVTLNRRPLRTGRDVGPTDREENVRLAWLVSSLEPIPARLRRFGSKLSSGGASVLALMARRGVITAEAVPMVEGYIEELRGVDEPTRTHWERVLQALIERPTV